MRHISSLFAIVLLGSPVPVSSSVVTAMRPCPFETFDFRAKFETYIASAREGDLEGFKAINGTLGREPSVHTAYEGDISTEMAFAHFGGLEKSDKFKRVLKEWMVLSKSDGDGWHGGHRVVFASMNDDCETCELPLNREKHYILEFGEGCDLRTVHELKFRGRLLNG